MHVFIFQSKAMNCMWNRRGWWFPAVHWEMLKSLSWAGIAVAQRGKESKPVCRVRERLCLCAKGWLHKGAAVGAVPMCSGIASGKAECLELAPGSGTALCPVCEHWCPSAERGMLRHGVTTPGTRMRWFQFAFKLHLGRREHLWRL